MIALLVFALACQTAALILLLSAHRQRNRARKARARAAEHWRKTVNLPNQQEGEQQ